MTARRSCKNGGFCLDRRVYSIQPRDFRALCNQRQHRVERGRRNLRHEANVCTCARELHTEISADRAGAVDTDLHEILRMRVAEISAQTPVALSGSSKPRRSRPTQREPARQAAETDRVASSSNAVEMSRMLMTPI